MKHKIHGCGQAKISNAKIKEKAMQKQGKGDVLIKERAREYLILQVCIQRN
ncbi:MAG: hypothetical protein ACLUE2_10375 [Bacteroides cellulosilyticus]